MAIFRVICIVDLQDKEEEMSFFRGQQIYPATENFWWWKYNKEFVRFGMVVTENMLMTIKLRYSNDRLQIDEQ